MSFIISIYQVQASRHMGINISEHFALGMRMTGSQGKLNTTHR